MKTGIGVLFLRWMIGGFTLSTMCLWVAPLEAQRVRFPSVVGRNQSGPFVGSPGTVILQPPVPTPFDPYALGPNYGANTAPGVTVPALPPPIWTAPSANGFAGPPIIQAPPPVVQVPPFPQNQLPVFQGQPPPFLQGPPPFADPNVAPALPGPAFPSTAPGAIFPDGVFPGWQPNLGGWFGGINALEAPPYAQLFEDFYGRYTWIHGDPSATSRTELQISEIELATSMVIPGSYGMTEEIRVTPGFIYDALGGPSTVALGPPASAFAMPSNLYSVYLDSYARAQFTPQFGGELNVRVGVYSDFEAFSSDTIRITGRGLLFMRLTPTLTIKGGIEYLDRNDIQLLPAGGLLWEPDPHTRFDIYFPHPKLAKYFTTVGANEIWWYVGGQYGGGAWTVRDLGGVGSPPNDNLDINDIRVFAGLDFTRPSDLTGFVEGGYVFEREIFYVGLPGPVNTFQLKSTFMLRAGLIW